MKKVFFIIMIISVYIIQHIYFDNNICFAVDGVPQLPGGNKLNIEKCYDGTCLDPAITDNAGADGGNIVKGIVYVINFILFFVGLIAFIFILYAGFLYLTAGSDENAHKKAITIIKNATIGIIIIVLSYAITYLLVVQLPKGELDGGSVTNPSSGGGSGGSSSRISGPSNVVSKDYTAKVLQFATGSYMYCTDATYTNCYNMPISLTMKFFNQTTNNEVNTLYSGINYKILVMLNPSFGAFRNPTECILKKDVWGVDSGEIDGDSNCSLTNGNIITFSNVKFTVNQNYRMKLSLKDGTLYNAIQFIDVRLYNENNNYVSIQSKQVDPTNYPNIYTFIPKCQDYSVDCDLVKNNYTWHVYKGSTIATSNDFAFINGTTDRSQSPQIKFKQVGEYDIRLSYYENEMQGVKMRAGTASLIVQINDTFNVNDIIQINMIPQFKNINDVSFFDYILNSAFANSSFTTPIEITINALENGSNDYKYDIDFGDGTKINYIIGQRDTNIVTYDNHNKKIKISYKYKNAGNYDIKLTVTKISTGRSFDINRQIYIGDGDSVKSVIISEIRLKYINADYIGDGSPKADADIPIYRSTNINFDASMSVGLSGIDKDLRYFWSIEENGREVFTSTQKKISYNFKYVNESSCVLSSRSNGCAKVTLRVTSIKDNFKTDEKTIYVRVNKEDIIPEFKTNNKLYISPANVLLEVDKNFINENEIVNYIWEIKNTVGDLYLIKNTASPKVNLNVEFNMGDEIQSSNTDFAWCKDLQGRIINIKLTVINTDGQTGSNTNNICILPNTEEPIVVSNVISNIYIDKDRDVVFSGYAKTRNNDIYNLIPKSSIIPINNQLIGIGVWSIVKTKEIPEVNSPIWNNTVYKCKNETTTSIGSANRYPDYCVVPIESMSEGDYYVRFMVTNASYKKVAGPNFYGYKINKFTVNDTGTSKIKSEINIQGSSQLKYNSDEQAGLFDHLASVKLPNNTVKWSIKYEFSTYYKIYEGSNFLTEPYQSTAYNPLVVKAKSDASCTNTVLVDKIKISNLTTNNKIVCLLSPGKYTFMLEIIDADGKKYANEKTIEIISNNQTTTSTPQPTTQPIGSNISARLTIKPTNSVYEGNDNAIHLIGDVVNVEFDFSKSIGDNLKYYFDADLSYDSNYDGNPSNDQDNTNESSTLFTYKYKREFNNTFRAQLKVVDSQGKTSSVIRTIKFDPR